MQCLLRRPTHGLLTLRACSGCSPATARFPQTATVRLAKPTSNLFRARAKRDAPGSGHLGADGRDRGRPATRGPPTSPACAPTRTWSRPRCRTGLSPLVVPQLKTITLGGAVTGLGHRVDVVPQRAAARVGARDGHPHRHRRDRHRIAGPARRSVPGVPEFLWHAWLLGAAEDRAGAGQAVRRAAAPAVSLARATWSRRWTASSRPAATTARRSTTSTAWCSAPTRATCALGVQTGDARVRSATTPASRSTTGRSSTTHGEKHDRLTIHDYLWRWDTDWFWCSRAFGAQNPRIRRLWPRRLPAQQLLLEADRLRPAVRHRRPDREAQRPAAARAGGAGRRGADRADRRVPRLVPGTTCRSSRSGCARCGFATPTALAAVPDPARTTPTSTSASGRRCRSAPTEGETNRLIEQKVSELDGHKSLYSDAYYSPEEFDELYGGETYKTREEDLRPRFTFPRPLREGGATTMTTFKERHERTRSGTAS